MGEQLAERLRRRDGSRRPALSARPGLPGRHGRADPRQRLAGGARSKQRGARRAHHIPSVRRSARRCSPKRSAGDRILIMGARDDTLDRFRARFGRTLGASELITRLPRQNDMARNRNRHRLEACLGPSASCCCGRFPPKYDNRGRRSRHADAAGATARTLRFPKVLRPRMSSGAPTMAMSLECLVVEIDGTTRPARRFDLSHHLVARARAKTRAQSNDVLRDRGWEALSRDSDPRRARRRRVSDAGAATIPRCRRRARRLRRRRAASCSE